MDTSVKLELRFETSEGTTRTMSINQPTLNLEPEVVKNAMEAIAAQGLFEREGMQLYQHAKSARYVTRSINDIFNEEAD